MVFSIRELCLVLFLFCSEPDRGELFVIALLSAGNQCLIQCSLRSSMNSPMNESMFALLKRRNE